MRKAISSLGAFLLVAIVLAGCGGGMSSTLPLSGTNMAQVSLTIHDNPPMGVTVLSFEVEVTGATLQASGSSQPVSLLSEPEDIEIEHLQTESALLASRSVPTGTYSGLMVTFANPRMTIQNQTTAPLTLGTQMCSVQQVCEFDPKLNQSSVTVQGSPFPIMLAMNSPLVLKMDFNIDTSVQNDLSITPTISVMQLPPPSSSGGTEGDEDMELIGQVTSIPSSSTFIIQSGMSGPSFTIATDTNTQFDFGTSCSMENFSCLKTGQIVKVDAKMKPDGSLLAFEVKLFQPPNEMSFAGAITSVDTGSFKIVLSDEEFFGGGGDMGSFSMGAPVTVTLASMTTFSVDTSGFMFPSGLNFASAADLMAGQEVRLHPTGPPTGTPPNLMITVDQVQLEPSFVTGTITALNTSSTPQTFTLGSLPSYFTNAGIMSIQVDVFATTQFETEEDQTVSGLGSLKSGDVVSVRGPLFKTMTMPSMAAEKVVNRSMSSGTSD
jgi:Domain of unknown function (DUF5666)